MHPIVLFVYYMSVLIFTMFTLHPALLLLSFLGSLTFYCISYTKAEIRKDLPYYFCFFLLLVSTNPLFSHNGDTILFFMNDHPITLESLFYGIAAATMILSVLLWFKTYSKLMTSDKILYLFGHTVPKLALILSMAIRYIPTMRKQMKQISDGQKTLGLYSQDSYFDRILGHIRIFNSLITWSLENAIETADSMHARGYGLKHRTCYSNYTFTKEDGLLLGLNILCTIALFFGFTFHLYDIAYYPVMSLMELSPGLLVELCVATLLFFAPTILKIKEALQWTLLKRNM